MKEDLKLNAPWEQVKEQLKENNVELTDADLEYTPGREADLLNRLSKKMKRDPTAVKALIESISANDGRAS